MWILSEFSGGLGADVIFVIDGSGNLGAAYFQRIKELVADVVSFFDIAPNKTRVGLITFRPAIFTYAFVSSDNRL